MVREQSEHPSVHAVHTTPDSADVWEGAPLRLGASAPHRAGVLVAVLTSVPMLGGCSDQHANELIERLEWEGGGRRRALERARAARAERARARVEGRADSAGSPVQAPEAPAAPPVRVEGTVGRMDGRAARLVVTANVPDVVVTLDGEPIGKAPLQRDGVAVGRHELAVAQPGFEPHAELLELAASEVRSVAIRLDPRGPAMPGSFGYLDVTDATPGRQVVAFGDVFGRTPLSHVPAPVGLYDVEFVSDDGARVVRRVTVLPGAATAVVAPAAPATPAPSSPARARGR